MRKNPNNRILKMELKEQYLNTVPKLYSIENIYILFNFILKIIFIYKNICSIKCTLSTYVLLILIFNKNFVKLTKERIVIG